RMELELLFDGSGQIPAEEHQRIATVALGVKEPPGFLWCMVHVIARGWLATPLLAERRSDAAKCSREVTQERRTCGKRMSPHTDELHHRFHRAAAPDASG